VNQEIEKLALRIGGPADIGGHPGDGQRIQDDRREAGIFQFLNQLKAFRHTGLGVDDARIMSVIVQMDIVIVVVFQPAAVKIKTAHGANQDEKSHNVKHEIHKRQGSFPTQFPEVRGATIRRVIYSFGRMILLFSSEYKGVDHTSYKGKTRICHRNRRRGVSTVVRGGDRGSRWR
jgi:hypothetical protein